MVQAKKTIALLHRYPADRIKETNAAFPYLEAKGIDVLTFKKFDRLGSFWKFWKSVLWIFYAPMLVLGKGYRVIYCDDSYPFYPALVKLASPRSEVVIRIGDFHLMYYYSGWVYDFLHFFEKVTWMMVDVIIVISHPMAEKIAEETLRHCEVVLDPVDELDFMSANMLKSPEKIVMFHGVLTKNKNIDLLIEAAERLPQYEFWIVGMGPDSKRLHEMAPSNVWFAGWVPFRHMYSYINDCNIGVALRSDNPGNEYVVTSPFLQYGVMGKPCLVTRRKVFGDYEWQFSGVDELVQKIEYFMEKPAHVQYQEGQKLKKYILENHDAKKIAEEIWHILM